MAGMRIVGVRRIGREWLNGLVGEKNRLDQGSLQLNIHAIRTWELRYSGRYTDSRSWTCAISEWCGAESVDFNNKEEFRTYQNHVAIPVFNVIREVGLKRQEEKSLRRMVLS